MPPYISVLSEQRIITALEGSSLTISFEVLNAHPPVTSSGITWRFQDQLTLNFLNELYDAELQFSSDYRNLTIININYNNTGRYFFTVFNSAGRTADFITIVVEGKLYFNDAELIIPSKLCIIQSTKLEINVL